MGLEQFIETISSCACLKLLWERSRSPFPSGVRVDRGARARDDHSPASLFPSRGGRTFMSASSLSRWRAADSHCSCRELRAFSRVAVTSSTLTGSWGAAMGTAGAGEGRWSGGASDNEWRQEERRDVHSAPPLIPPFLPPTYFPQVEHACATQE